MRLFFDQYQHLDSVVSGIVQSLLLPNHPDREADIIKMPNIAKTLFANTEVSIAFSIPAPLKFLLVLFWLRDLPISPFGSQESITTIILIKSRQLANIVVYFQLL